jgi:ABC-type lipoprotein release transport system permease subunit
MGAVRMLARAELRNRWKAVVVAVGHALVTAVWRRRRDLALLKTLGFDRRQVRATIAWQATTLAVVGLLVGVPLGTVVGRLAWGVVASGLGVATDATVPALVVLVLAPAALIVANLIAVLPARAAARTRPALVLRSE